MNKFFFIVSICIVNLFANPYKSLNPNIQLELIINYFLTEQVKEKLPEKPVKEVYKQEAYDPNPKDYELYYNYIQRLKAIAQTKKDDIKKIEEKFRGKASYYNGKIEAIKVLKEKEIK